MLTRRVGLIAASALLFVLAVAVFFVWRSEPRHGGKSLSEWAEQFRTRRAQDTEAAGEARAAIRAIGTNAAVPFLLDLIRTEESSTKRKLRSVISQTWHEKLRLKDVTQASRRTGAHGLAALGTNAPSAVSALMQIASTHPDEDGRYIAVFALRTLGQAVEPAIPFLVQCLTNQTRIIRDDAAIALAGMRLRPELCAPALIDYLGQVMERGGGGWELANAVFAVGQFGTNSKPAESILIGLLKNEQEDVRRHATNALRAVNGESE